MIATTIFRRKASPRTFDPRRLSERLAAECEKFPIPDRFRHRVTVDARNANGPAYPAPGAGVLGIGRLARLWDTDHT